MYLWGGAADNWGGEGGETKPLQMCRGRFRRFGRFRGCVVRCGRFRGVCCARGVSCRARGLLCRARGLLCSRCVVLEVCCARGVVCWRRVVLEVCPERSELNICSDQVQSAASSGYPSTHAATNVQSAASSTHAATKSRAQQARVIPQHRQRPSPERSELGLSLNTCSDQVQSAASSNTGSDQVQTAASSGYP